MLRTSLEDEDLGLLQRWAGLALIGWNIAQRILILSGTAGAGKGTFIRILKGVVGEANIGSLRTDKLSERFEIGRLLNKTLLYGADVPSNFLNMASASILKSLTGGDPMTVEFKGSMDSPSLTCAFNVIVTSNSRLTVQLSGFKFGRSDRSFCTADYQKPGPSRFVPGEFQQRVSTRFRELRGNFHWRVLLRVVKSPQPCSCGAWRGRRCSCEKTQQNRTF